MQSNASMRRMKSVSRILVDFETPEVSKFEWGDGCIVHGARREASQVGSWPECWKRQIFFDV